VLESRTRSLKSLSETASTSRVLNLSRVYTLFGTDEAYNSNPFFVDPTLNRAIFLKHRLRANETYLVPRSQAVATKIIFPFDAQLLKLGGRSIFVGQTGYRDAMLEFMGPETKSVRRDLDLLALLETLPSLDPFLLKEHLARKDINPADCYFNISAPDMERMRAFASAEIGELITMAFGKDNEAIDQDYIARLVDALMGQEAGGRLDPLRLTLGLTGQAFHDGVFSWKGFLYYKWQFGEAAKKLNRIMSDLDLVKFEDTPSSALIERFDMQRPILCKSVRQAARECTAILSLYDDAFRDLVDRGKAGAFRKFLLEAPRLFVDLGSRMGVISHIVSYWTYRFPDNEPLIVHSNEFASIILEFQNSLHS
jgi:hypothetical protein